MRPKSNSLVTSIVLDASALLTLLNQEQGWDVVARQVTHEAATISAINYAEVLQEGHPSRDRGRLDAAWPSGSTRGQLSQCVACRSRMATIIAYQLLGLGIWTIDRRDAAGMH